MDVEMYLNTAGNKARYAPRSSYSFSTGDESVYLADPVVAFLPGVKGRVAQEAADGAAKASVLLALHRDTGNSRIVLDMAGGPDWVVALEDPIQPDGGGLAALAIEGETNALTSAFGIPSVRKPNVIRDKKTGRFVRQYWDRDSRGRFTGGGR